MKKIYIGCSITGASEKFKNSVKNLVDSLDHIHQVLQFYSFVHGKAPRGAEKEVFEFDIEQIDKCDLLIAILTHPSTGLGYEIAYALSKNKRVLGVALEGDDISKLIEGITHPKFTFKRVKNLAEVTDLI